MYILQATIMKRGKIYHVVTQEPVPEYVKNTFVLFVHS